MNFTVDKAGPLVPTGVNQKSFLSIKIQPMESKTFKTGDVLKMTSGKVRLRNEEEKAANDNNSLEAVKGDTVRCEGNVIAQNQHKEEHAAMRVFRK